MKLRDPNLDRIERVATVLAPLMDRLVLVGGCAAGLLMEDPGVTPIRMTMDIDLVTHVTALLRYHELEADFEHLGFRRDMTADAPICRWVYQEIQVDLMPTDAAVLGFANRWYPLAVETAQPYLLPSGTKIQLISGPAFLATKFEAFEGRGKGDLLASHDLEDIVTVVAARPHIAREISSSPEELSEYLSDRMRSLLETPNFEDYLPALLNEDSSGEPTETVITRIREVAKAAMRQ